MDLFQKTVLILSFFPCRYEELRYWYDCLCYEEELRQYHDYIAAIEEIEDNRHHEVPLSPACQNSLSHLNHFLKHPHLE